MNSFFKKAFTLAEVISVLVILGIVAAITIPTTLKKSTERANRTKIKKAMAAYDKALSKWYISDENLNYTADYKTAMVIDPNNELSDLSGEEYTARRRELISARNARRTNVQSNYANKFSEYFNTKTKDANNPSIFQTKDGLWWDVGTDGKFLSVIVAFKREDLNSAIASSEENKAFYFVAQVPDYAKTPITNPTYGVNFENLTITDFKDAGNSANLTNIVRMQKLYNYINMKTSPYIAGQVCSGSNCCNNTTGSCISIYSTMFGSSDSWKDVIGMETKTYKDGAVETYTAYNPDNNETVFIDYVNSKIKITKNDGTVKCHTFEGLKGKDCSAVTQVYWDLYNWNCTNSCTWTDYATMCRTRLVPCD